MIFGSTKTKLDYIIELGCKRIDDAVEGVIAKYPTPQAVEIEAQSTDTTEFNQQLRDVATGMGMAGIVAHRDSMRAQREYNFFLQCAADAAQLGQPKRRRGESISGSPLLGLTDALLGRAEG